MQFINDIKKAPVIYLISVLCTIVCLSTAAIKLSECTGNYYSFGEPRQLSSEENDYLNTILDDYYPRRNQQISYLPYEIIEPDLDINAESCILIDTSTGNILYEKNADEEIPPASMTKLVEMYVVYDAVSKGEVTLDDIVPLPPECWAINLPRDASIMFLADGQIVTLRELLLGLAIASGNDASIAVAKYIAGDMDSFVQRMNDVVQSMGLTHTHFVESSGYSELNITTAREFAIFAKNYINQYPEALTDYHSQKVIRYPLEKNLPSYQKYQKDGQAVIQYNTNKLIGKMEGCDGLKTGFIYESGYNLSLTAKRDGIRFLSVTMKGPGIGSAEGNKYRSSDAYELMNFAFDSFADYFGPEDKSTLEYTVAVPGGKETSIKLKPAYDATMSVPFITGEKPKDSAEAVQIKAEVPPYIEGRTESGQAYGNLYFMIEDKVLNKIPLIADRSVDEGNSFQKLAGKIARYLMNL